MNQFSSSAERQALELVKERDALLAQLPPGTGEEMDEALKAVHGAARHSREVRFLKERLQS